MVKKTLFGTIVIGVKTTTIGGRVWGSTQYSKDSWDSESASRGSHWMKNYEEKTSNIEEFLPNPPHRFLAVDRPG